MYSTAMHVLFCVNKDIIISKFVKKKKQLSAGKVSIVSQLSITSF